MILFVLGFAACGGEDSDSASDILPTDTQTVPDDTGMGWFEVDTALDTGYNQPPIMDLLINHSGEWELSPIAGPYQILIGEMHVQEIVVDNNASLWCDFTIALTGEYSGQGCNTCDFAFNVEFYVNENPNAPDEEEMDMNDPPEFAYTIEDCMTPDLPSDQGIWEMGFSSIENTIFVNYENSGFWLPWYEAYQVNDSVLFEWETNIGIYGLPDDD